METNFKFNVGQKVYVEDELSVGFTLVITSRQEGPFDNMYNGVDVLSKNLEGNVVIRDIPESYIRKTADSFYSIGDKVRSVLGGGFVGIVVGFELSTNRVICMSEKVACMSNSEMGRTRYAYKLNEIKPYAEEMTFQLNHKYRDQNGIIYRTMEHPCTKSELVLYENARGLIVTTVPLNIAIDLKVLRPFGIVAMEDTSVKKYNG